MDAPLNIYQLSGLDARERGFTRQVECCCRDHTYQVVLRYERLKAEGKSPTDEKTALEDLIRVLQAQGYTQLRSQLIFQGKTYLGSQELWVDYPDPECAEEPKLTVIERVRQWLKKRQQLKRRNKALRQC